MSNDPFATTTDENNTTNQEGTTTVTTPNIPNNTEAKIVVTLKGGAGYDAPWIVIHADTIPEAQAQVSDSALADLMKQTKKVAEFFVGPKQQGGRPLQPGQPAGSVQPSGAQPTPPEGYVYKSGVGKNGKPWYAFMGANRSDNLDPIWLNADGSRR